MTCPRCQHENPVDATFCDECRARLEAACAACGEPEGRGLVPNGAQAFFTLATVRTISLPYTYRLRGFRNLLPMAVMMTLLPREVKLQTHVRLDGQVAQHAGRAQALDR